MPIEQEYKVDKKHRRAFRDVCTSLFRILILLTSSAVGLFMAHIAESEVISLACCIVALIPCVFAIVDQILIAKAATEKYVWRIAFNERNAVHYRQDGKSVVFPYRTVTAIHENESFLKITSKSYAAVLKKDELPPDMQDEVTAAIAAECPSVKRRTVHGRTLICAIITAVMTTAVLAYSAVCLIPIMDGFAFAPPADEAVVACYTETYSISRVGCWSSPVYESDDGRSQLLYVGNYDHEECPPEVYYVSFSDGEWHVREVTQSDVPLEFRTDTARVRVIQIDECCLLEIRCNEELGHRTENLVPYHWWNKKKSFDGEYHIILMRYCPDGIQKNSVLYLDDEAFFIGEMLSSK